MAIIEHRGRQYEVDKDGFLVRFEEWDEGWVDYIKGAEGICKLSDVHQKVMVALQEYYKKNKKPLHIRNFSEVTGIRLRIVYDLFPSGYRKGAYKMAGLKDPGG
ncbi:MAG: TusE/DsrC/DsvC family sulfur relay protein [Parcubacteria group bacterium]|jgi:tRNA 2-thiouridine synthesizing protein E